MRTHRKRFVVATVLVIMLAALLASLSGCKERSGGAEDPVVEDVSPERGGGAEDPVVEDVNE